RVVVDASFREGGRRSPFSNLAGEMALPCLILHCEADPSEVMRRLELRENDPSDADWDTYLQATNHTYFPSGTPALYTRNHHKERTQKETAD
ncbi:MAG: AAA family ATPase, partial [Planctomycetota bacterium]|nr:AAA family ATPase [Planctomycetota bacterium]